MPARLARLRTIYEPKSLYRRSARCNRKHGLGAACSVKSTDTRGRFYGKIANSRLVRTRTNRVAGEEFLRARTHHATSECHRVDGGSAGGDSRRNAENDGAIHRSSMAAERRNRSAGEAHQTGST